MGELTFITGPTRSGKSRRAVEQAKTWGNDTVFVATYASDGQHWDYDAGAIEGSSFLILPRWLNWFTANIAYHHVHHLSARIPNYRLIRCHNEYRDLFSDVTRVKLSDIHKALKYILWDKRTQRIISVAEYESRSSAA